MSCDQHTESVRGCEVCYDGLLVDLETSREHEEGARIALHRLRDAVTRVLRVEGSLLSDPSRDELHDLIDRNISPRPCERERCILDAGHYGDCLVSTSAKETKDG